MKDSATPERGAEGAPEIEGRKANPFGGVETGAGKAKKAHKSKTVWLNLVAVVSAFLPKVQEWLAENPVEIVSAFAALNILVRFVTSGKVSLIGSKAGTLGAVIMGFGFAGLSAFSLSSCTSYDVTGSVGYRDEETGAKGGLRFDPGRRVRPWVRVPIETPEGAGFVDLEGK